MHYWKYAALGVAALLWGFGLADQLESYETFARYMALSAGMVAVMVA